MLIFITILIDQTLPIFNKPYTTLNYHNFGLVVPFLGLLVSNGRANISINCKTTKTFFYVFISPAEPYCRPVREGDSSNISCSVDPRVCPSDSKLAFRIGKHGIDPCANYNCRYFVDSSSSGRYSETAILGIRKVSRNNPVNMEGKWTCYLCDKSQTTACEKLQIYGKLSHWTSFFSFLCLFHCCFYFVCAFFLTYLLSFPMKWSRSFHSFGTEFVK